MAVLFRLFAASVLVAEFAAAAPAEDAVPSLPLYGAPPTKMYSGYLDAKGPKEAPGCATSEKVCQLHYWLAEAEQNPASAPVVLWLNGGPGSSSVLGMLQEQGPLIINATGGLTHNPYSWTKVANLVVLESPTGVGYSYCSTQLAGGICKNTDKLTASAARAAVVDFFTTKFPELRSNEFFVTGESVSYPPLQAAALPPSHAFCRLRLSSPPTARPLTTPVALRSDAPLVRSSARLLVSMRECTSRRCPKSCSTMPRDS